MSRRPRSLRPGGRPRVLSAEQVEAVRARRSEGATLAAIAREFGCGVATVHRALRQEGALDHFQNSGDGSGAAAGTDSAPEGCGGSEGRVWPPPADSSTVWRRVRLREGTARVRRVRLWGRDVEVDEAGKVFCDGCLGLLDPQELLRPGTGHRPRPDVPRVVAWDLPRDEVEEPVPLPGSDVYSRGAW